MDDYPERQPEDIEGWEYALWNSDKPSHYHELPPNMATLDDIDNTPTGKVCQLCGGEDVEWDLVWRDEDQEWIEHCHCFDCHAEWDE